MPRSATELLVESSLKAISVFTLSHPIGAGCALVLSGLIEIEPIEKLIDLLGEELAKAVALRLSDHLTEIKSGSLPEAFVKALAHAIREIKAENKEVIKANHWDTWFCNWEAACERVHYHRWKDLAGLAQAVGFLNQHPEDWRDLRDTLILLDWSARLAGISAANRNDIPQELEALLCTCVGEKFIAALKELLASKDFSSALVDLTFEIASVAVAHAAPVPLASRVLASTADPRLRPMRGFFTGRVKEVEAVTEFLRGTQKFAVVTGQIYNVQGGPGVGKTEICKAALRAFLTDRPETRAYYVDVTGIVSLEGLQVALADTLGDPRLAEDPLRLLRALKSQSDLIYLDNLEDALPEQGDTNFKVFAWLEAMEQHEIKVLASCRRRLGSMSLEFSIGRLSIRDASELFEHFWHTTGAVIDDPKQFRRFIERDLDCHALTIRLLAVQGAEWKTWQILRNAWLTRRTKMAQDAGRHDRASSLDVSVSLTFDQVKNRLAAADLWIAFACFPEGMSQAAQRSLLPDESAREAAVGLLRTLGVIYQQAGADYSEHFEMLAPLRQFAAGLDKALTVPVWERCLAFFGKLADMARSTERAGGGSRALSLQPLLVEFGNLQTSISLGIESGGSADLLARIHQSLLNSYQFNAVASREMVKLFATFFIAANRNNDAATALRSLGDLESRLGKVDEARKLYGQALPLYESEQANLGRANTLRSLGDLESRLGKVDEARKLYGQALPLYESEQDNLGRANTLQSLGNLESRLGKVDEARKLYGQALPLYESEQANLGRANTLKSLGDLESRLGKVDEARKLYGQALPLYESEQDNLGRANTLQSLGDLESRLGKVDEARKLYGQALPLYESEQDNLGRANTLNSLGDLESRLGKVDEARKLYGQALPLFESEQDNLGRANTLKSLGDLESRLGKVDEARKLYGQALPLYESEQANLGRADTLKSLGDLESRLGKVDEARKLYGQALPLYESEQANLGRANTLKSLGDLESRLGKVDEARKLYGQALPLYESEQANLGRANTLQSLGNLESRLGKVDEARKLYGQALPLYESEQDNLGRANTLKSLGDLESRLGKVDEARKLYGQALPLYESEQDNLGGANTLNSLGDLESRLGKVDEARKLYGQALPLYESEQDNLGRANTLKSLGDLELGAENLPVAASLLQEALVLFEAEREPVGIALTSLSLAITLYVTGKVETAKAAIGRARDAARASNIPALIEHIERLIQQFGL